MNTDHIFLAVRTAPGQSNTGIRKLAELAAIRTDNHGNVLAAYAESLIATPAARRTRVCAVVERLREIIVEGSELLGDMAYQQSCVVVAWNGASDVRSIMHEAIEKETDEVEDFLKMPWLDLAQLAWPMAYHDLVGDRSMQSLCASFGFATKSPSLSDECKALTKVYWALMARYKAALVGEEVIRNVGGKPLQTIRKLVGW